MNNEEIVNYQVDNHVATITLNRPKRFNAFIPAMGKALLQALQTADSDEQVRAIIFTGAGDALCSGADLEALQDSVSGEIEAFINEDIGPSLKAIYQMDKPIICAFNGLAAGGGCIFPLICDLTVMAEEAYYYPAFGEMGLVPDCGISWLLQRQIGTKLAYQLSIENKKLSAERCLELGLVNSVVPRANVMEHANQWANTLVKSARLVPGQLKKMFKDVTQMTYEESIAYEAKIQDKLVHTLDSKQRREAFVGFRPSLKLNGNR